MFLRQKRPPTIFHITHQKAGSQWIYYIFELLIPKRIVAPIVGQDQFLRERVITGACYPTIYLPKEKFETVSIPANHRKFVIIRDLRDTLVSFYFSTKYSHPIIHKNIKKTRDKLNSLSKEESLIHLMKRFEKHHAVIQDSWINSGEMIFKYEELIEDETGQLLKILKHCQIDKSEKKMLKAIAKSSFKKRNGGRQLGEENKNNHFRKGVPGDWRNHFSEPVKSNFKEKFGNLLIKTGYEKNLNW
ncbi:sulfotransferase domain-containing protein [Acidobacteriota bacterium]